MTENLLVPLFAVAEEIAKREGYTHKVQSLTYRRVRAACQRGNFHSAVKDGFGITSAYLISSEDIDLAQIFDRWVSFGLPYAKAMEVAKHLVAAVPDSDGWRRYTYPAGRPGWGATVETPPLHR